MVLWCLKPIMTQLVLTYVFWHFHITLRDWFKHHNLNVSFHVCTLFICFIEPLVETSGGKPIVWIPPLFATFTSNCRIELFHMTISKQKSLQNNKFCSNQYALAMPGTGRDSTTTLPTNVRNWRISIFEGNGFEDSSRSRERSGSFKGLILFKVGQWNDLMRAARFKLNGPDS